MLRGAKLDARRGDKATKRSIDALARWNKELRAKRSLVKEKRRPRPRVEEKVMLAKIHAYEQKLYDQFKKKYSPQEIKTLDKACCKARECKRRIETRLKHKFANVQ